MMTRRINLTLAASCLALILVGVIAFAATGEEPTSTPTTDAAAPTTEVRVESPVTSSPAGAADGSDDTVGPDVTPSTELTTSTTEPAAPDGEVLYATHCASCHGTTGEGGSGGPVDDLDLTLEEVIEITADGAPRMPGYADVLTTDEIEAVSTYTLTLSEN